MLVETVEQKDVYIKVVKEKCPEDHVCPCISACPVNAIVQDGMKVPVIDDDKCIECGVCVKFCPTKAFELVK